MRQGFIITLITEEPDDRIGHVRICGGDGHNARLYPEHPPDLRCVTPFAKSAKVAPQRRPVM